MSDKPLPSDDELRRALRASAAPASTEALEQRVLAQWQQRHARPQAANAQLAGGPALVVRHGRWFGLGAAALSLAVLGWCNHARQDASVEELLQLDVLSQMTMGEM